MKAELLTSFKESYEDGTFIEVVIWKVPENKFHPHGLKYRLHFGNADGTCIARYDNESGKGDHRHIGRREEPYQFVSLSRLLQDFRADVHKGKTR